MYVSSHLVGLPFPAERVGQGGGWVHLQGGINMIQRALALFPGLHAQLLLLVV